MSRPLSPDSEIGYIAVHLRLRRWHGRAADAGPCVDCGREARDWSYLGGDADERTDKRTGLTFTPNLAAYQPRCRSCHRTTDLQAG